jgi:hypothetical protein
VLAYGSNASPAVLARKLGPGAPVHGEPVAVPGVDVVFSRHVSPHGAIPATVVAAPGTTVEAFVLHLTPAGLEALAATEPNYELERVGGHAAFVSRHGPLAPATALAAVPARGRVLPALTEAELLERVRARVAPALGLEAFCARLVHQPNFRRAVHLAL